MNKKTPHVLLALAWYHPQLHLGIADYAREHGWYLEAQTAQYRGHLPQGWRGDGIITNLWSKAHKILAEASGGAIVSLGNFQRQSLKATYILQDHSAICRLAQEHLCDKGFRHFAWYNQVAKKNYLRFNLFSGQLQSRGFDCMQLSPQKELPWQEKAEQVIARLRSFDEPVGVMCSEDNSAAELLHFCKLAGLKVPEQVAIIGVNNDDLVCSSVPVTLSSVEVDYFLQGRLAAAELQRQIMGKEPRSQMLTHSPSQVVERMSTDVFAVAHPGVAKTLNFIQRKHKQAIYLDDIISASGLSSAGLFKAFHAHLQRTPGQELLRQRLQSAKLLIAQKELNLAEVAEASGFGSYANFYKSCKRELGITPKYLSK